MNTETEIKRPWNILSFYDLPEDVEQWKPAPCCGGKPWQWRFDNGLYARCSCNPEIYIDDPVTSESIMSRLSRCGNLKDYDPSGNALRDAWNKWAETGEKQSKLPEGQW